MSMGMFSLAELSPSKLYAPAEGYDLVAEHYDLWAWQEFWRKNEFPLVLSELLKAAPTRAVLDVGAGTGAFLAYAAPYLSRDLRLVGLDISAGMLERAHLRTGARVNLLQADIRSGLPLPPNYFDVVIMMRVVNHLKKLDTVLREISRVLSPAGVLLATDLADEYDYACTRIPTPRRKIRIETYKHSHGEWHRALKSNFSSVEIRDFSLSQLGKAPVDWKSLPQEVPLFKFIIARR